MRCTLSPAELRARLEKDGQAMAILTRNGLSVRDYLIGTNALVMASESDSIDEFVCDTTDPGVAWDCHELLSNRKYPSILCD